MLCHTPPSASSDRRQWSWLNFNRADVCTMSPTCRIKPKPLSNRSPQTTQTSFPNCWLPGFTVLALFLLSWSIKASSQVSGKRPACLNFVAPGSRYITNLNVIRYPPKIRVCFQCRFPSSTCVGIGQVSFNLHDRS